MIFYKNNRPIISIPTGVSLKISLVSISCLPSHTLVRKVFKVYLYFRIFTSYFMIKYFSKSNKYPLDKILVDWFEKVILVLGNQELYPVYIWSLVEGRQRYYVHLLDADGNKKYFTKITTKKVDYNLLENEKKQLEYFSNKDTFYVPRVVNFEKNEKYCSLITSYLEEGFNLYHPESHTFPKKISLEICEKPINLLYSKIVETSWWKIGYLRAKSMINYFNFINSSDAQTEINVCKIHGDFGSENIFINNKNKFYIIDWERSTNDAPYLTDMIAFWLGGHHKLIKENSAKAYEKLMQEFKNEKHIDLAMALLFLISVNFDLAILVAEQWESRNK